MLGGCDMMQKMQHTPPPAGEPDTRVATTMTPEAAGPLGQQNATAFHEALDLLENLRYDEAAARLDRVAIRSETLGDKKRASECRFWQGYCYEKQGMIPQAGEMYRKAATYGECPGAVQARQRLALLPIAEVRPAESPHPKDLPRPSTGSLSDLRVRKPVATPESQPVPAQPEVVPPEQILPLMPPAPPQPASAPARVHKSVLPPEDDQ